MKTIQDAVIEFDGKWLNADECSKNIGIRAYTLYTDGPSEIKFEKFGTIKRLEFEAEAKRLGYINGYRWGVEYPTNGKRPDLPDDVIVSTKCNDSRGWLVESSCFSRDWRWKTHFKITDPRYKPADTSYLGAVSEATESKPEAESVSEWHDYDKQVAVALPPVGVECEYKFKNPAYDWTKVSVNYISTQNAILVIDGSKREVHAELFAARDFRPLDWSRKQDQERREFVDRCLASAKNAKPECDVTFAEALFDAGCRFTK